MASKEVKKKLQMSILNRKSFKQIQGAQEPREGSYISELELQHSHLYTPPSTPNQRSDSFHSSSNSLTCQCSPPLNQSDYTPQTHDYVIQPHPQMDTNPGLMRPMKVWIQPSVTVTHETMLPQCRPIVLKHVHLDTAMFTSPHLAVIPGVCFGVNQHRPLERSYSQPLMSHKLPREFHQRYSCRKPQRLIHIHKIIPPCATTCGQPHPEVEERTAVQETGRTRFTVGEETSVTDLEEFGEEFRSNSLMSHSTKLHRRHAVRKHNRSNQRLPRVASSPPAYFLSDTADSAHDHTHRTGMVYDPQMLKQKCICGDSRCDAKHAGRIPQVFTRLSECGVSDQFEWIKGKECGVELVQVLHQSSSFDFGANLLSQSNPGAVMMAAGCVTELVRLIDQGQLRNGFAIVQPHGCDTPHSSPSKSMATFTPVAVAAKQLQKKHNNRKILILDWDVHHCNLTQELFYTDPNVLHISLHHYGNATLSSVKGGPDEVGSGDGKGFNINVAWSCDLDLPIGDTEYLAAFRTVIKPIAQQFSPDVILISTEFNTVDGHPASQGGLKVSAKCFGILTQILMELSGGHVVLVLQRGHDVTVVCEAFKACVNALLENKVASLSDDVLMKKPCPAAIQSLHRVLQIHSQYWSSVRALTHTLGDSWLRAERKHTAHTDTATALASLSMTTINYTRSCAGGTWPVENDEEDEDKIQYKN